MTARAIRLKKEVRALFWPWFAVTVAGALPILLTNGYTKKLNLVSFFVGVPLLAALSLGNEFQQGTLSLWLTQPLSRKQLWGEKMSVVLAAALSAGLVSGIGLLYFTLPQLDFTWRVASIACVLVATASAPFGTLAARSTLGGFILIAGYLFSISLLAGKMFLVAEEPPVALPAATITAISVFGLCCTVLVLWLGARRLARFQVRGGRADSDLLMAGPSVLPEVLAGWLRFRPSGAFGNLIRKELRLQRPFWLSTLVALSCLALAAIVRRLTSFPIRPEHPRLAIGFAVFCTLGALFLLAPIFAGILSLGEERTSGTQALHMTLPVSPLRQWLIKLVMALLSGFASAVLLPLLVVIAVGSVYGSPFLYVDFHELRDWMIMVPILTFAAFWCACAANGTVRASLWAATVPAAIIFARVGGTRLGEQLAQTTGTLRDVFLSWFHLSPLTFAAITDSARGGVLWLFVPTLVLALVQSYRLFRVQPQESVAWMMRCVLPLVVVTILWNFSASTGFVASTWEPFTEVRQALHKLQSVPAQMEMRGEDLAKGASLTALTRRWLAGASLVVVPDHAHASGYLATIHLASGVDCQLVVTYQGAAAATCGQKGRFR